MNWKNSNCRICFNLCFQFVGLQQEQLRMRQEAARRMRTLAASRRDAFMLGHMWRRGSAM